MLSLVSALAKIGLLLRLTLLGSISWTRFYLFVPSRGLLGLRRLFHKLFFLYCLRLFLKLLL